MWGRLLVSILVFSYAASGLEIDRRLHRSKFETSREPSHHAHAKKRPVFHAKKVVAAEQADLIELDQPPRKVVGASEIPKIVFYTGRENPKRIMDYNRQFAESGTEFWYYNDAAVYESVINISRVLFEETGIGGVWNAFRNLRPMAYRIDLWRYLALWDHGGLYLDDKLVLTKPLQSWLDRSRDTIYTVVDLGTSPNHPEPRKFLYYNAVIAAKPRDAGILAVIRHVVDNIERRQYEFTEPDGSGATDILTSALAITGPRAMWMGLAQAAADVTTVGYARGWRNAETNKFDFGVYSCLECLDSKDKLITEDRTWHMKHGGNEYCKLFKAHSVFCDEPEPGDVEHRNGCVANFFPITK